LQADLQGCKTIYGTIARILEKRMADNAGPLTLLNCDNVRHNGERFHDGMVEFLQLTGKQAVIDWMAANTTCPNTMVDRITPRPAADLPARIKAQTGIDDKAPVMGETFIQWVVEDNFRDERPNLEAVGVEMVESVIPYEEAKIRILNASHSCIAWAGTLIGQQYIHESTLTDFIYAIADRYVTEDVIPCLGDNGIDLPTYRDVVLKRFTNPYIQDTNQRVAADGFSKIPAMIAPTCRSATSAASARRRPPCCPRCSSSLWSSGTRELCRISTRTASSMLRRCMRCLNQDPVRFTPAIKRCLVIWPNNADFLALMREKVAAVYTLIN
jgi:D-arabinitol 4-dehydrogenase